MNSWKDILNSGGSSPMQMSASIPPKIRKFYLKREEDESGVSGTGIVAVGVILPSKRCVIEWVSKRTAANSLGIYDDLDDVEKVHGHEGKTKIEFYNGEE